MRREARLSRQKRKKAESLERLSSRVKNFGEFRRENNPQHLEAQVCLRLSKSLPFSFLHRIFYFSRIGRQWLRQAVCKTVAVYALEVQILPDAFSEQ